MGYNLRMNVVFWTTVLGITRWVLTIIVAVVIGHLLGELFRL